MKCHLPQHLFNTNAKRFFKLLFMDKQIDELWKGFSIHLIIIPLDDFTTKIQSKSDELSAINVFNRIPIGRLKHAN